MKKNRHMTKIFVIVFCAAFFLPAPGSCVEPRAQFCMSVVENKSMELEIGGANFSGRVEAYGICSRPEAAPGTYDLIKIEAYRFERSINRNEMMTLLWKTVIGGKKCIKLGRLTKVRLPSGREGFLVEYRFIDDAVPNGVFPIITELYGWTGTGVKMLWNNNGRDGNQPAYDSGDRRPVFSDNNKFIKIYKKETNGQSVEANDERYAWNGCSYTRVK